MDEEKMYLRQPPWQTPPVRFLSRLGTCERKQDQSQYSWKLLFWHFETRPPNLSRPAFQTESFGDRPLSHNRLESLQYKRHRVLFEDCFFLKGEVKENAPNIFSTIANFFIKFFCPVIRDNR